jgi:hypothetical protein
VWWPTTSDASDDIYCDLFSGFEEHDMPELLKADLCTARAVWWPTTSDASDVCSPMTTDHSACAVKQVGYHIVHGMNERQPELRLSAVGNVQQSSSN